MADEQKITKTTHLVEIHDEYLSQSCIEKCINEYNNIKVYESHPILEIIAHKPVKEVDPLLIAYFVLFKKQKSNLEIIFNLNTDTSDDVIAKVGQYKFHAQLTSGENIFKFSINESIYYPPKWIVWSKSFLPITFIDSKSYKNTFIDKVDYQKLENHISFDSNNNKLYEKCREFLYNQFLNEKNGLTFLSQLAFYKALDEAKILSLYLYPVLHDNSQVTRGIISKETIRAGNLRNENALEFYNKVKEQIFDQLYDKPPIYHFIYSTLLSSDLLPGSLTKNNSKEFIITLKNLWDFTVQLIDGLNELSKNIIQHSHPPLGVITGRVYTFDKVSDMQKMSPENNQLFSSYLETIKIENGQMSLFEINVIDSGNKGIIETLKDEMSTVDISDLEKEDLDLINENNVAFEHFLNPSIGLILNQQAKRATAHLGLLIFSKLIEKNNGMIRAGTRKLVSDGTYRDNVLWFPKMQNYDLDKNSAPLSPMGTNYHFILPFDPNKTLTTKFPLKYELPTELSSSQIRNMEDLFTYDIKDFTMDNFFESDLSDDKNYLFLTNSDKDIISANRIEENKFWEDIVAPFLPYHQELIKNTNPQKKSFVCLNLNESKINVSQLFRLAGKWELEFPGCPFIIYNLTTEYYFKIKEINEFYYNKLKNFLIPYWNKNSLILFYSFIQTMNGKFYFADAMWGNEPNDFLLVNQLIHKTNFNATITLIKNDDIKIKDYIGVLKNIDENIFSQNIKILARFGIFQNGITLLPFDLLLKSPDGLTLFEHNAMVLLQNPLRSEKED